MTAKELFLNAVENYDPVDWDNYLDQACGGDTPLRQKLAELLTAHSQQNPLLENAGIFSVQASESLIERPGMTIGPFKLIEEIGEGGFGIIFLCEQIEPIRRKVALKVLKPGLDSRQVIARFEAERQTLAMMEHPNIARVLDVGLAPSGRPYFAMELVMGKSIIEYFDQWQMSLDARLRLLCDVCRAVQHAHLKGIVHRDVKPSNVMVATVDNQPVVKVIDFGIAKATGKQPLADGTLHTNAIGFVGTPAYMSPEQLSPGKEDADIRCDVYSLGVLLYETLTGETPFDSSTLHSAGYDEMRRMIRECEPPRPSTRVSTLPKDKLSVVEANRQVASGNLSILLRRELDWIAMKAIEKDRSRRYQSASDMADDIQRYLSNAPVQACPPSQVYQLQKFTSRYHVALITTGLVLAAILIGFIASLRQANRATAAMRLADQSLEMEKAALERALKSEADLQLQFYASNTAQAWSALMHGDRERARAVLDRYHVDAGKPDHREFSWRLANSIWNASPREFVGHEASILTASLSPDNRLMVSGDRHGTVKIWELSTGHELASWKHSNKELTAAAFSPDGKTLATAGQDRTVRLWDTSNWEAVRSLRGHANTVCSITWSPDGTRLASGARDHSVRIWDVATGKQTKILDQVQDVVRQVRWTPDNKRLFIADGNDIRSWNTQDWQESMGHRGHTGGVLALAISPDGKLLATSGYDKQVVLYSLAADTLLTQVYAGTSVWSLTFSPDGNYLVSGMVDGGPRLWRIQSSGSQLEVVRDGFEIGSTVRSVDFTKDQTHLMVASEEDKKIRLWDSKSVFGYEYVSFPEDCTKVDSNGVLAVNRASGGSIVLRDFSSGSIRTTLEGHSQTVSVTAISKSNRWLASYANDNVVLLWDLQTGTVRQQFTLVDALDSGSPDNVQLEFSLDEQLLAASGLLGSSSKNNSVRIWNVSDGSLLRDLRFDAPHRASIGFSLASDRIAVGTKSRFFISPLDANSQPSEPIATQGAIWHIEFLSDGKQLATCGDSLGVAVWNAETLQRQSQFSRQRTSIACFALSPDGQTLAAAGTDQQVQLWHFPSGQLLCTLLHHSRNLIWMEFVSNSKLLVGSQLTDSSTEGVFVFNADE